MNRVFQRWLLPALVVLVAFPLAADELAIRDLSATTVDGRISVHFELQGAMDREDILKNLQSGLPTIFEYEIDLVRYHKNWLDRVLVHTEVEVVATFNSVTREYLVNYRRDGKLVRSDTLRDLSELRTKMTVIDEPRLFDPDDHPIKRLKVRARADIGHDVTWFIIPRTIGTGWSACRIARDGAEQ